MHFKFWITIVLSFALAAFSLLGFGFLTAQVGTMENSLSAVATDIAALEEERHAAASFSEFAERRSADMRDITGFYIARARPVRLLEDLESTARDASTTISVTVDEAASTESALLFQVAVGGSEPDILRFLRLIEFLPYDLTVEAASVQLSGRRRGAALSAGHNAESPADAALRVRVRTAPQ